MAALRRTDFEAVTDDAFSFLLTDHAYAAYPAEAGGYLGSGFLRTVQTASRQRAAAELRR